MTKSLEQFGSQEPNPEKISQRKLFKQLIVDAHSELNRMGFTEERSGIQKDIVKAMTLSGDFFLESAEGLDEAKKEAIKIPDEEDAAEALVSIVRGLSRKDPKRALELASKVSMGRYRAEALLEILISVADKWDMEEVEKLADRIVKIGGEYYPTEAELVVVGALVTGGQIETARKKAGQIPGPANKLRAYLSIYKSSQAPEDIQTARVKAAECKFQPYEKWLQIAEASHDPSDIAMVREKIAAIRDLKDIATGTKQVTHFRERALIALAKITGEAEDIRIAREAVIAAGKQSLLMDLARFTLDDADINLLRESGKSDTERFDALAAVAEITQKESDFRAAYEAAKKLRAIYRVATKEYLQARSFMELAQILCGEKLRR